MLYVECRGHGKSQYCVCNTLPTVGLMFQDSLWRTAAGHTYTIVHSQQTDLVSCDIDVLISHVPLEKLYTPAKPGSKRYPTSF